MWPFTQRICMTADEKVEMLDTMHQWLNKHRSQDVLSVLSKAWEDERDMILSTLRKSDIWGLHASRAPASAPRRFLQTMVNEMYKACQDRISKELQEQINGQINELMNKEVLLDNIVERIKRKQLSGVGP